MSDVKPSNCLDTVLFNEHNLNVTKIITQIEAKAILKKPSTKDLFTNNIFTVSFEPLKVTASNVDMVFEEMCPTVCVTYASYNTNSDEITAISFSTHIPVRAGVRFDVTFYGSNSKLMVSHVIRHLTVSKIYQVTCNVSFMLSYPTHINGGNVEETMKALFQDNDNHFIEQIPLYICYKHSDVVKKNCAAHLYKLK